MAFVVDAIPDMVRAVMGSPVARSAARTLGKGSPMLRREIGTLFRGRAHADAA